MVDHYLQKRIIADLVESETARYADLKPGHIEGNVFTYHLHSLVTQKLIVKNDDGSYELTSAGKLYGINGSLKAHELLEQAHAIVLISARDEKGRWLLRKRLVQPMFNKVGFVHGEPKAGEPLLKAGVRIFEQRTGLSATMVVKGSGYICLKTGVEHTAYSSFTLLQAIQTQGTLKPRDAHGENEWYDAPDFASSDMIPSMADLVSHINKPGLFFLDKIYEI